MGSNGNAFFDRLLQSLYKREFANDAIEGAMSEITDNEALHQQDLAYLEEVKDQLEGELLVAEHIFWERPDRTVQKKLKLVTELVDPVEQKLETEGERCSTDTIIKEENNEPAGKT
jgi:hypothetical protein